MGISIIISAILAIAGLVFKETITNVIKNFSSNLSKRQTIIIFFLLLFLSIVAPIGIGLIVSGNPFGDVATENQSTKPTSVNIDLKPVVDGVLKVSDKWAYNHSRKDSIRMANREQFWVYQIGTPKKNTDELWETLKTLSDIPYLYIFKESRKSYYIVKDDGYTKEVLNDSLAQFKSRIDSTGSRLKIIDLMTFCSKREKIKEGDKIKEKKGDIEVRCYVCDK